MRHTSHRYAEVLKIKRFRLAGSFGTAPGRRRCRTLCRTVPPREEGALEPYLSRKKAMQNLTYPERRCFRTVPSEEEGDVEGGAVEIHKLEEEHLEGEAVLPLRLCARLLCKRDVETTFKVPVHRNSISRCTCSHVYTCSSSIQANSIQYSQCVLQQWMFLDSNVD